MDSQQPMFDVFLAHNSADKMVFIKPIAQKLKERGLKPWLDIDQIPPGRYFQDEIQKAIANVKSAAIFISTNGIGKWQALEVRTFMSQCIEKKIPVIPVLLTDVTSIPEDLFFFKELHCVYFTKGLDDNEALDSLIWGITGQKPKKNTRISDTENTTSTPSRIFDHFKDDPLSKIIIKSDPIQFKTIRIKNPFEAWRSNHVIYNENPNFGNIQYFDESLKDESLKMVFIEGDSFLMGSQEDEPEPRQFDHAEGPPRLVKIEPFFISMFPITQAQWIEVSLFQQDKIYLPPFPSHFQGKNLPVEQISWHEAVEFCRRLSRKTGREYRLPSEAEWEYSCRAGTTTPFHFGKTIKPNLANYNGNTSYGANIKDSFLLTGPYLQQTTKVEDYSPNAFGLYDMHGNVWEWCADHWHRDYSKGAPINGLAWMSQEKNAERVLRGGSWDSSANACRSAFRIGCNPNQKSHNIGFRIVYAPSLPRKLF
jgi:formylglycine-generating enzyme required for sulfatase activity